MEKDAISEEPIEFILKDFPGYPLLSQVPFNDLASDGHP